MSDPDLIITYDIQENAFTYENKRFSDNDYRSHKVVLGGTVRFEAIGGSNFDDYLAEIAFDDESCFQQSLIMVPFTNGDEINIETQRVLPNARQGKYMFKYKRSVPRTGLGRLIGSPVGDPAQGDVVVVSDPGTEG